MVSRLTPAYSALSVTVNQVFIRNLPRVRARRTARSRDVWMSRAPARRPAADALTSGGADAGDVAGTERAGGRAPRSGRTGQCDREGSPAPRVITRQRNVARVDAMAGPAIA